MKLTRLIVIAALGATTAAAQTPAKPASAAAAAHPAPAAKYAAGAGAIKLPPGVPAAKGLLKNVFQVSLRYQDIKLGTGPLAEPKKLYKIHYTGWRAADGVKFDSSYDHPGAPVMDKDGKPVMDPDGKPKMGAPQPVAFPQGVGGLIVGMDQGLVGMRIGGKRRVFVPWQLGYGTRDMPDRGPSHPGIPPKSDLIFDVELVDVADLPAPMARPAMPDRMQRMPIRPGAPAPGSPNGAGSQPGAPATAPKPAAPPPPQVPAQQGAPAAAPQTPSTSQPK